MFYSNIWDPWLIISQMIVLQCSFYLLMGSSVLFLFYVFGDEATTELNNDDTVGISTALTTHMISPSSISSSSPSSSSALPTSSYNGIIYPSTISVNLDILLSPGYISFTDVKGWNAIAAYALTAPLLSYLMLYVVCRAKQVLDYSCTLFGYHLLLTYLYEQWPKHWEWYLVNVIALIVTIVLGEYLCMKRELEAIPMGGSSNNNNNSSSNNNTNSSGNNNYLSALSRYVLSFIPTSLLPTTSLSNNVNNNNNLRESATSSSTMNVNTSLNGNSGNSNNSNNNFKLIERSISNSGSRIQLSSNNIFNV